MQKQLLSVSNAASIAAVNAAGVTGDQAGEPNARGMYFILDVTSLTGTGTPSLQLIVELKDSISGKYVSIGTFTAVTAPGTYTYGIGLGIAAAADGVTAVRGFPVPDSYRARVVGGGSTITDADFTLAAQRA